MHTRDDLQYPCNRDRSAGVLLIEGRRPPYRESEYKEAAGCRADDSRIRSSMLDPVSTLRIQYPSVDTGAGRRLGSSKPEPIIYGASPRSGPLTGSFRDENLLVSTVSFARLGLGVDQPDWRRRLLQRSLLIPFSQPCRYEPSGVPARPAAVGRGEGSPFEPTHVDIDTVSSWPDFGFSGAGTSSGDYVLVNSCEDVAVPASSEAGRRRWQRPSPPPGSGASRA